MRDRLARVIFTLVREEVNEYLTGFVMENQKVLMKLAESTDLIRMVEDLLSFTHTHQLSPASLSGVRVTLRNIREALIASQEIIAEGGRRSPNDGIQEGEVEGMSHEDEESHVNSLLTDGRQGRGNLRSSFERMVHRQG